jgi:hypothetical protein
MKSIFNNDDYKETVRRIEALRTDSQRKWGKMDVAQMMAHCSQAVEVALGDWQLKRTLLGRIFGPLAKKDVLSEKPFKPGNPTAKEFRIVEPREFEKEKSRLLTLLDRMNKGGEAGATKHPHGFFGHITPKQWGEMQWKHLDHHLRQFGV